jgi:hypothetical protein
LVKTDRQLARAKTSSIFSPIIDTELVQYMVSTCTTKTFGLLFQFFNLHVKTRHAANEKSKQQFV